jgi:hypothetical protein
MLEVPITMAFARQPFLGFRSRDLINEISKKLRFEKITFASSSVSSSSEIPIEKFELQVENCKWVEERTCFVEDGDG